MAQTSERDAARVRLATDRLREVRDAKWRRFLEYGDHYSGEQLLLLVEELRRLEAARTWLATSVEGQPPWEPPVPPTRDERIF